MKKILIGILLCGLLFAGGVVGILYLTFSEQLTIEPNSVLQIEFTGELTEHKATPFDLLFSEEPPNSLHGVLTSIRRAATDPAIAGIILNVISPQIGLAQVQEIEAAMKEFRETRKWSLSFLETAGSQSTGNGAYALAITADEVILSPPGAVNLIGLKAEVPFFGQLFKRLSLVTHIEKRKEFKNAPNSFTHDKFTAPHRESLKVLLDGMQLQLNRHIAARRDVNLDTAKAWVQNGPHSSKAAKEQGIVDIIAYYDHMLSEAEKRTGRPDSLVSLNHYLGTAIPKIGTTTIGVIVAAGEIHRGKSDASPLSPNTSVGSVTVAEAFRAARKDGVAGILFRVNSPGGSYVASDLIRREVELCRDAGIPVVVTMGNVAGSGGYFIAMEADYIVASPATITGSIGVYGGGVATRAFLKRHFGVTFDSYQTSNNANLFGWLDAPTGSNKKQLTKAIDDIYNDFVGKAAKARNKSLAEAENFAKGRIWSGEDALRLGLVDELGGYFTAQEHLIQKKLNITDNSSIDYRLYPVPDGPFKALRKTIASSVSVGSHLSNWVSTTTRTLVTSNEVQLRSVDFRLE